jgi:hypothetical protein
MKKYIITFFLLIHSISNAQTKEECLQFIKTVSKTLDENLYIDSKIEGNKLIIVRWSRGSNIGRYIEKQTLDMSKVESVVIDNETSYHKIFINFTGEYYKIDKYADLKNYKSGISIADYGFKDNWVNIFSTLEESKANKIQKYFVRLSKLCGSKVVTF